MDQIRIGRFIANLRKEKNLTQLMVADKLGVTDRAVSKWENGRGLPDISLMVPLCELFEISVVELLNGERLAENDSSDTVENNVIDVLYEREKAIERRRSVEYICIVMFILLIVFAGIFGVMSAGTVISCIRGEGSSVYTWIYTRKAEIAAGFTVNEKYENAVKYIGFDGQDKTQAQKKWVENMTALSDEIEIECFEISEIFYDDYYPYGKYFIIVYDRKSDVRYVFDGLLTIQDKGIAFGGVYISSGNTDYRRQEIAAVIENALCTWNAG